MESSSCSNWAKLEERQVQCSQAEVVEAGCLLEREEGEVVHEVVDDEILTVAIIKFKSKLDS